MFAGDGTRAGAGIDGAASGGSLSFTMASSMLSSSAFGIRGSCNGGGVAGK